MQLGLTVAGTVETFDQDAFKTALAASLNVSSGAISLNVTAASVHVVATIVTTGESGAPAVATDVTALLEAVQTLTSNVTALTQAVGDE